MNPEGHHEKAERLEASLRKLSDEADYELVVEACYGAAVHHIAVVSERRRKRHLDTHKGLAKFLDENDLADLASPFRELEILRTAKYYGSQKDGTSAKAARRILGEIKAKLH